MGSAKPHARSTPLDRVRDYVGAKSGEEATFGDVVALAEITAESMQAFFATIDRTLYRELREISDYIVNMRSEIAHLRAGDLQSNRLPSAGQDLGAIVQATEDATNSIMEAAEALMEATSKDEATLKAVVNEKAMAIFEACSFQDLTGQRIARVIATLEHVEERIGRFASAVKTDQAPAEPETEREKRARELLIHGPQDKDVAIDQDQVDALFS